MELPQAAEMVGRAMAMPELAARMLRQANIHLSDAVEENIKQLYLQGKTAQASQVILDELTKHIGGNAEKMASASQIQAHATEESLKALVEGYSYLSKTMGVGADLIVQGLTEATLATVKFATGGYSAAAQQREFVDEVNRGVAAVRAAADAKASAAKQEKKDAEELLALITAINEQRAMAGKGKMTVAESPHNVGEGKDKFREQAEPNLEKFKAAIPKDMLRVTNDLYLGWADIAMGLAKSADEFAQLDVIARSLAADFDVRSQADQFAEALKNMEDRLKALGIPIDVINAKMEELREKWGMKDPEKGVDNYANALNVMNEKLAKTVNLSDAAKDRIRGALEKETFGGPTSPAGILEEKLKSIKHEREAIENAPAYLAFTSHKNAAAAQAGIDTGSHNLPRHGKAATPGSPLDPAAMERDRKALADHDRLLAENARKERAAMEEAGGGILTPLEKEQAAIRALNDKMATGIPSAQAYADELKRIKDATLSESGAGAWLDKLDPLRHYGEELAKINRLEKDRLLTQQQATEARSQSYKDVLSSSGAQSWLDKIATPADKVAKQFAEIAKLRKEGLLTGSQYDQSAMAIMKDANPAQKPHEFHAAIEDLSSFNARIMGAHASKGDPAEVAKQQHLEAKRGADGIWRLVDMLGHGGGQSRGQERVAQIRQSQGARVAAAASINPFQFGY
jgi:hypothetical protein